MRRLRLQGGRAVLALGLALSPLACAAALAQEPPPPPPRPPSVLSVSAEGQAAAVPDMAVVTLSVMRQADSAKVALDDNSAAMAKVLEALKAAGIAERDLQTSGFYIQPQYIYPQDGKPSPQPPKPSGYQVVNTLTLRLREVSKLGTVLDRAVELGVNQGGDIQFTNQHPEAAMEEARKDAVAKAMAKARTLAEAAGVKLGRVISIGEDANRPPQPPVFRAAMMKESSDAVPVAAGENNYNLTVTMSFELVQ